jgi:shikimate kinase
MLNPDTAKAAVDSGSAVVFLDVPFEVCYERIKDDTNRPIVVNSTKDELKALYDQRREVYLRHSNIHIACADSPIQTAEQIAAAIKK